MLPFSFALGLIALWLQATIVPTLPISPFVPFLALASLLRPFKRTLWLAFFSGLCIDLLGTDPLGIYALNSCLTAAFCFQWHNRFSADVPMQFSLYTALFSFVSTVLQILLLFLFDRRVPFDGKWWMTEWMTLPICDALYALLWFAGPLALYQFFYKTWVIYWLKKKDPSTT